MHLFFTYLYRVLKRKRLLFFVLFLFSIAFSGYYASQIKLEEDISRMLPTDAKVEKLNRIFQNSNLDRIVVTLSLSDSNALPDPALLMQSADGLAADLSKLQPHLIREITSKMDEEMMFEVYNIFMENLPIFLEEKDYAKLENSIRPEELDSSLARHYSTLQSPISFVLKNNIFNDPLGITPHALKRMEGLQFDDNFELDQGYVFTKDRKHLLLFVSPEGSSSDTEQNTLLIDSLELAIAKTRNDQDNKVAVEYFGGVAVAVANAKQVKSDTWLTLSITLIALFLFITFFFRRVEAFFIIFIPVAFGGAFSLAMLYFLKGDISGIAIGAGSIVLGIAMDYAIHFYTHFKHAGSAEQTVKDLSFPLTLGSITTIGALLSLLFVKSEALNDFGMFAAFSLFGAALFTLILFPHLMRKKKAVWPVDKKPNIIERLAAYPFEKNKVLIAVILLICFLSLFTAPKVEFESDMMKMNYVTPELAKAEKNLNTISNEQFKNVFLVSDGKNLDKALSQNEQQHALLDSLEKQGKIARFSSISTIILSKAEQRKRIKRWNDFWTAEKKEKLKADLIRKSAEYKFKETAFQPFYDLLGSDFRPIDTSAFSFMRKNLIDNYISGNTEETTVITVVKVSSENENEVVEFFEKNTELTVFNKRSLTNKFIAIIKDNFNLILGISALLVLAMLILSYGRLELALITYIPMVLSWLCILGMMGAFGITFNIINIIVSTFIFGLGDDYSIFMTDALMNEYKTGKKDLVSHRTGIFISAITTLIGIGVLIFAEHPALRSIGLITIIGMFSVLVISNTILPALFRFFISNRTDKKRVPFTLLSLLQSLFAFAWFAAGCFLLIPTGLIIVKLFPLPKKTRIAWFQKLRHYFNISMIYVNVHVKKKIINPLNENFEKPAIIICNHHSVIDALLMQALNPKLVLLVNDWVWNSPFMGPIVRLGGFVPKSAGYEENLDKIKELFANGYSLAIFPEGSRSMTAKIGRFHKGAFYIAERLNMDIVPIIFHGTAFVQGKDDSFLLKPGIITVKYLPRIDASDTSYGKDYNEKTKNISRHFKAEYAKMRSEIETVDYYVNRLSKNYIYKGPVLEWYMRIKVKLEDNYRLFDTVLPKKGLITDIGCGYGFLPYMLAFMSEERNIIGMDYDEEKIAVASNAFSKTDKLSFHAFDVTGAELPQSDAFVLSDILHYLPAAEQEKLLVKCFSKLNPDGMVLLRDADSSLQKRHWGTRYTEFFSTKFGFNKTKNKLEFVSGNFISKIAAENNMSIERIDNTKLTSNITYIIKHG